MRYGSEKISCFLKAIFQQYTRLERSILPYLCKIDGDSETGFIEKNNEIFAKVIYSGQIDMLEIPLSQVIEKNFFELFSPEDKKKLFSKYDFQKEKSNYKISFSFDRVKNVSLVSFENHGDDVQITKTASEIINNKSMRDKLNKDDIKTIAWFSAKDFFNSSK